MASKAVNIAVMGAGSWGTALAMLLARNGHRVRLWGRPQDGVEEMQRERVNARYLPDYPFPEGLEATSDLDRTLEDADLALVVVPSHAFRSFLESARDRLLAADVPIVWGTKGLEHETGKLMSEVAEEVLGPDRRLAIVSGPTFAKEVAAGMPTAVAVAARDEALATEVAGVLHSGPFRAYTVADMVGVQLGGALKNVLAIAAGAADGFHFGANTRAAVITRGLAEIMRLGDAMGGQRETFMGLAGLGDLVLTCTDDQSRNRRFGLLVADEVDAETAIERIGQAVEGVKTAGAAYTLARRFGVDTPIMEQVYRVIYQGEPARTAVQQLLARDQKPENI